MTWPTQEEGATIEEHAALTSNYVVTHNASLLCVSTH